MLDNVELLEREWMKNPFPEHWIRYLPKSRRSARKRRLFACACCRYVRDKLTEEVSHRSIEAAEQFADGKIDLTELAAVRKTHRQECKRNGLFEIRNKPKTGCGEFFLARESTAHPKGLQESRVVRAAISLAGERSFVAPLAYDIFGNPYRLQTPDPTWLTPNVRHLAEIIYEDRQFDAMPILGDALEEAGCENETILSHCREYPTHARGCWVVDLLLNKN